MTTLTRNPIERTDEASKGQQVPSQTNWRRLFGLRERGVYYALLLLITVLTIITTYLGQANYLSVLNLSNVVYQSSLMAIMAVAMTVVLISGNFDLSVASVAALAAAILIGNADAIGFFPAAAVALLVAMGVGLLNGVIVQYVGINAFIVTLGTMTAVRGLVLIYTDGRSLSASNPDVIAAMRAFEGGRHEVYWLVLVTGALLLALGAIGLFKAWSAGKALRPSAFGMAIGGILFLLIAYASDG